MISATAQDGDRARFRQVARIAKRLDREGADYCRAEAAMLRAAIAHAEGDDARALPLLAFAEETFGKVDLRLNEIAVRRARGLLLGGDLGAELVRTADAFHTEQGVRRPDRVAEIFAPGFKER
jgi:hypothetical protein